MQWLQKCYPDSAPLTTTIKRWFADFKRTDTDDAERSGHPNQAVNSENIEKTIKIIMGNRKIKLQETTDTLKLSEGSVFSIIHKHLGKKSCFPNECCVCSHQKQKQQFDDSEGCLDMFKRNKLEFLH